jgi:integrase
VESGANIHNRCWSPLLERAKVPYMNFHRLRHFHASNLIASGANPKHVCTEMGHSSIKVTYDIYGHLFAEDHGQRQERADMMAARLLVR